MRKYDFENQNFAIFGGSVFHFGKNSISYKNLSSVCLQIVEPSYIVNKHKWYFVVGKKCSRDRGEHFEITRTIYSSSKSENNFW